MAGKERLPRLIRMIFVIQRHPGLSAREIAGECGVSQRQFYRDLSDLQEAGIPIYTDRGYRMVEGFTMRNLSFTLEEAFLLLYGIKLAERQGGLFKVAGGLKAKLLSLLPQSLSKRLEGIENGVETAKTALVDYSGKESLFRVLNTALIENRSVRIVYYSFTRDELTERTVDPYKLVFNEGFWYLAAFCRLREAVKLFRVDRIREFELLADKFEPPADFNFEAYLGSAWGMERGEEFQFKVRFSGTAVRFARETRMHSTQRLESRLDGTLIYTAKACGFKSILRWVLQFGSEAEVLGPPELRELVKRELEAASGGYAENLERTDVR